VPKSKKVVTKVRNGHLKSGHQKWSPKVVTKSGHQKWSPKVVTKSGHQKWSPDQKLVTRSENEYRSEKYSKKDDFSQNKNSKRSSLVLCLKPK
jgi:hypothetical protein